MKWLNYLFCSSVATAAFAVSAIAGDCVPCGGCSDPCGTAGADSAMVAGSACGGGLW